MIRTLFGVILLGCVVIGALMPVEALAEERMLTVAATTSIADSGLADHLFARFHVATGTSLTFISQGSAHAMQSAQAGRADVVFVNDPVAEDRFERSGAAILRRRVMSNDFIIVGPEADPARIRGMKDAAAALREIARQRASFVSRADGSGTHAAEQRLWDRVGINPKARSGRWLVQTGLGMGLSLGIAVSLDGYILTDRATWLAHRQRGRLGILVEGDPRLANQYEVMLINPAVQPGTRVEEGRHFIDWLVSEQGQAAIAAFSIDGQQVFFPSVPAR